MSPNRSYDLKVMQQMLSEAEKNKLSFDEKWQKIGEYFGASADAARKWHYRENTKASPLKANGQISSDQWRTIYHILTGKTSRDKIADVKAKILELLTS